MIQPIARLPSGNVIDVDLLHHSWFYHKPILVAEARHRIALNIDVPTDRIRLLTPTQRELLEDHMTLVEEVTVIVLSADPEVEQTAEASLLSACQETCIDDIAGRIELFLNQHQLNNLPESFGQLKALQRLDLNRNQFKSLPGSFGQLTALQRLGLNRNQLKSLPESFGQLTALQRLGLNENQLKSLPESFGQLAALQAVGLFKNQLKSLPESFGQLTALQTLSLEQNQLESLPESFSQLTALQELWLEQNQLKSLPESFGQLTALQGLALYGNQLKSLPESFSQLTALQELWLGPWLRMRSWLQPVYRTTSALAMQLRCLRRYRSMSHDD